MNMPEQGYFRLEAFKFKHIFTYIGYQITLDLSINILNKCVTNNA